MSDVADLTTLANAKAWLGLSTAVSDDLLARLITACSTFVQSWLSRTIRQQTYTETRNGTGGNRLLLLNSPVTAVSSVAVDGIAIPARGPLAAGGRYGYVFDDIGLTFAGGCFPRGVANVDVTYVAGYPVTPPDIEQACIDLIGDWFKYRDRIGKTAEGIEGQTISFVNQPLPTRTLGVLQQYRQVVPIAA